MGDSITANAGVVKVDGLPITFSCFSRPGNDPMKRSKENQDSMTVIPNYGSPDQMFIAVFDGHGPNGAQASQFVRSVLPQVCGDSLSLCVACNGECCELTFLAVVWQRVFCDELATEPFLPLRQGCVQTNKEVIAAGSCSSAIARHSPPLPGLTLVLVCVVCLRPAV